MAITKVQARQVCGYLHCGPREPGALALGWAALWDAGVDLVLISSVPGSIFFSLVSSA